MEQPTNDQKQHVILRVIEYGLKNQLIILPKMQKDLGLSRAEFNYVENTITEKNRSYSDNPNHILVGLNLEYYGGGNIVADTNKSTYTLLPTAFFSYVDHQEIVIAKQAAKDASRQAMVALKVAIYSIYIGIAFGLWQIFYDVVSTCLK